MMQGVVNLYLFSLILVMILVKNLIWSKSKEINNWKLEMSPGPLMGKERSGSKYSAYLYKHIHIYQYISWHIIHVYSYNTLFILYLLKYIVWVYLCCPGVKYIIQKILNPKYFGNCSFNKPVLDWLRFVFHFVMKTTALLVKRF